jgi:hypothetical protein
MEQNKNVIPKKESLIELETKLGFSFPESWLFVEHNYPTYEDFLNIPKTTEQLRHLDRMFRNYDNEETTYYENTKYLHKNGFITPIEIFLDVRSRVCLKHALIYYTVKPYDKLFIVVYNDEATKIKLNSINILTLESLQQISYEEFYRIYKDFL